MNTLLVSDRRKIAHTRNGARVVMTPEPPSHDDIARRAYELFLDSGCPEGRDVEFWLEAERQLTMV